MQRFGPAFQPPSPSPRHLKVEAIEIMPGRTCGSLLPSLSVLRMAQFSSELTKHLCQTIYAPCFRHWVNCFELFAVGRDGSGQLESVNQLKSEPPDLSGVPKWIDSVEGVKHRQHGGFHPPSNKGKYKQI